MSQTTTIMARYTHDLWWSGLILVFIFSVLASPARGLSLTYCSSQNTGGSSGLFDTFQSNGLCQTKCKDNYAFGVVQGGFCWCSNYIPSTQTSVSDCNQTCPGFPDEHCGSTSKGLFGYIALSLSPSGTAGSGASSSQTTASSTQAASSTTSSSTTSRSPTSSPLSSFTSSSSSTTLLKSITSQATVTPSSTEPKSTVSNTPTQASSTSQPPPDPTTTSTRSKSSSTTSSTWTPTPITTVQLTTVSGAIITQTVTTMPTAPPEALRQSNKNDGASAGAIAGGVIGGLAGLAMIGAAVLFLLRRRRTKKIEGEEAAGTAQPRPRRNVSTMSKAGLLDKVYPPAVPTVRHSAYGTENSAEVSPTMSERRNSRPLFYDQRLNPTALMGHENGSHASFISIQDNRDYTRTLNVTNPDPPRDSYAPNG